MNEELKIKLIMHYIAKSHRDAFANMTVYDVAKDLKIGMTRAYELFNEKDFPSVTVGKTKVVMVLSYYVWKYEKYNKNLTTKSNIHKGGNFNA